MLTCSVVGDGYGVFLLLGEGVAFELTFDNFNSVHIGYNNFFR
jgi:hypothetical protein